MCRGLWKICIPHTAFPIRLQGMKSTLFYFNKNLILFVPGMDADGRQDGDSHLHCQKLHDGSQVAGYLCLSDCHRQRGSSSWAQLAEEEEWGSSHHQRRFTSGDWLQIVLLFVHCFSVLTVYLLRSWVSFWALGWHLFTMKYEIAKPCEGNTTNLFLIPGSSYGLFMVLS